MNMFAALQFNAFDHLIENKIYFNYKEIYGCLFIIAISREEEAQRMDDVGTIPLDGMLSIT